MMAGPSLSGKNLVSEAKELESWPDELLQTQLSNPTGLASPWLIATEVERRSAFRQDYNQQATEPPQSTVIQDILAQSAGIQQQPAPPVPQGMQGPMPGGIGSVPGMGAPPSMQGPAPGGSLDSSAMSAGGGMANGGLIRGFADNRGIVSARSWDPTPEEVEKARREMERRAKDAKVGSLTAGPDPSTAGDLLKWIGENPEVVGTAALLTPWGRIGGGLGRGAMWGAGKAKQLPALYRSARGVVGYCRRETLGK